ANACARRDRSIGSRDYASGIAVALHPGDSRKRSDRGKRGRQKRIRGLQIGQAAGERAMQLRMQRKRRIGGGAAVAAALWLGWAGQPVVTGAQSSACGTDLKVLVLSADGSEPSLTAITQTLDYLGTPYVRHVVTEHPGAITP